MSELLPPTIQPDEPMKNPLLLPPLTLAYVGDAVYELFIRKRLLERGVVRVGELHKHAVKYVRARAQAGAIAELHPTLSEQEQDVVRRGRNAKSHSAPKGSDAAEYAASTSFETLAGYLYLAGRYERLEELFEAAARHLEQG
ncbi:MAG TPA: ribonuclease III domain-containing protein [Symbiobacteriaceae bacterium]|jgi:ribonuclease-3 family protein|nr:ribonuclease III domain-containing protein [Symbiobacteriaceae bacterium]